AVRIEKRLGKTQGVREASVNYATGEAVVTYDADAAHVRDLVQAVEKSGYGVRAEVLTLPLAPGATPPSPAEVEAAFERTNGVLRSAVAQQPEGTVLEIGYLPALISPADLVRHLESLGWPVLPAEPEAQETHDAQSERETEYLRLKRRLVFAAVLTVPVAVLSMSHGAIDFPGMSWLLLALT